MVVPALLVSAVAMSSCSAGPAKAGAPRTTVAAQSPPGATGATGSGTPTTTTVAGTSTPAPGQAGHRGPFFGHFSPPSSPVGGVVTLTGRRFGRLVGVSIDGIPATVVRHGPTRIEAIVPAGATSGPITVETSYGSVSLDGFVVT